jgi:hypothetical protein
MKLHLFPGRYEENASLWQMLKEVGDEMAVRNVTSPESAALVFCNWALSFSSPQK